MGVEGNGSLEAAIDKPLRLNTRNIYIADDHPFLIAESFHLLHDLSGLGNKGFAGEDDIRGAFAVSAAGIYISTDAL